MAAPRINWTRVIIWTGAAAILAAVLRPLLAGYARSMPALSAHAPDWGLLARQPIQIKVHLAAALFALGLGAFILQRRKGAGMHRTLGWGWVAALALTAASSLFITGVNGNSYSLIHLLSGWTLVSLPLGIYAVRRGRVGSHRSAMTSLFVGGLIVAGALAFLPGRLMWRLFFG